MADHISALTADALDAHAAGDTETRDMIFGLRDRAAQDASEQGDAGEFPHRPAIFDALDAPDTSLPVRLDPETLEGAVEMLREQPGGEQLLDRWGTGADEALGYANTAATYVARSQPDLANLLNMEVKTEDGETFALGNHPAIIEIAAMLGRLLHTRDGTEPHSLRRSNRKEPAMDYRDDRPSRRGSSVEDRIAELLREHPVGSDSYKSPSVQRQLQELYLSQPGGKDPITGRDGRTA